MKALSDNYWSTMRTKNAEKSPRKISQITFRRQFPRVKIKRKFGRKFTANIQARYSTCSSRHFEGILVNCRLFDSDLHNVVFFCGVSVRSLSPVSKRQLQSLISFPSSKILVRKILRWISEDYMPKNKGATFSVG